MQALHDKTYNLIVDNLCKDTIDKYKLFLASENKKNINTNNIISDFLPPVYLCALGSNPGAGKTSFCASLLDTFQQNANQEHGERNNNNSTSKDDNDKEDDEDGHERKEISVVISQTFVLPIDGYHRYRSELSAMKNPEEAFRRRGAPFTFNDEKYAANMEQLKKTGKLNAPAFAHAKKDPEEDFYKIDVAVKVVENDQKTKIVIHRPLVIVEGLYCLYDVGDFWAHALRQFDLKFFLKIDIDVATARLVKRHMRAWNISEEEAHDRAGGSDRDNGLLVIERAMKLAERGDCIVLDSVDDVEFAKKYEHFST